jgi:hypothetical protein
LFLGRNAKDIKKICLSSCLVTGVVSMFNVLTFLLVDFLDNTYVFGYFYLVVCIWLVTRYIYIKGFCLSFFCSAKTTGNEFGPICHNVRDLITITTESRHMMYMFHDFIFLSCLPFCDEECGDYQSSVACFNDWFSNLP